MEYIPVVYFYFIWVLAGLGLALLVWQVNRLRPVNPAVLLAVTIMVAMLLVTLGVRLVWRGDIDFVGWGFYAYPPTLAGILTFSGWQKGFRVGLLVFSALNTVIGLVALGSFLGNFDEHAYGLAYVYGNMKYDLDAAFGSILEIINSSIDAILIYLAATIIPQVILYMLLPWTGPLIAKGRSLLLPKTAKNYSKT